MASFGIICNAMQYFKVANHQPPPDAAALPVTPPQVSPQPPLCWGGSCGCHTSVRAAVATHQHLIKNCFDQWPPAIAVKLQSFWLDPVQVSQQLDPASYKLIDMHVLGACIRCRPPLAQDLVCPRQQLCHTVRCRSNPSLFLIKKKKSLTVLSFCMWIWLNKLSKLQRC